MNVNRLFLPFLLCVVAQALPSAEEKSPRESQDAPIRMEKRSNVTDEGIDQKSFCKDTIKNCQYHGGVCLSKSHLQSYGCTISKTFDHFQCPTCYCCIKGSGSGSGSVCETTPGCKNCGGRCSSSCAGGERPYNNLCGYGSCKTCCVAPCQLSAECQSQGGHCVSEGDYCNGKRTNQCGGFECQCCVPLPIPEVLPPTAPCEATEVCKENNGKCKSKCKKRETEIHGGCNGKDCKCCAPSQTSSCSNDKKCNRRGGVCCDEADCIGGHYTHKYCGDGEGCGCCINNPVCKEKDVCKDSHGTCKSECKGKEVEIPRGCKGRGCKCCAAPLKCEDSQSCASKGGICCAEEACTEGKFMNKFCGYGCGCCIHY